MVSDKNPAREDFYIELPQTVVAKLNQLAGRLLIGRSELIENLISEKLHEMEKEEVESSMKEGYLVNYNFIKESCEEWDVTLEAGLD